ncbi:AIR synthase-related protein [Kitasatospora sp. NBC_01287]|uniref:AIR synthase-related protein n=1 Tax=Kitasatospora sp. NBC_01287 TaxID=2903573 RepID=UPI002250DFE4|nr:AIR synthase-related protein [Kitasatospora sp. NBC_01287]MCX4750346.1 AIR synthase-related protein [Kitasatospora sp. NBC_01287]
MRQVALGSAAPALVRAALDGVGPASDDLTIGQLDVRTGVFVVDPPFFGNGDVGRAAVCGVVNELAAAGAEPRRLALGVIVEAGLPVRLLQRLVRSIREAAREAGVAIAAVDTKVVRAGEADQVFVTATAFGVHRRPAALPAALRPGDRILVTGALGDHAAHLLTLRGAPGLEQYVDSDCAPLAGLVTGVRPQLRYAAAIGGGGLAATLDNCSRARGLTLRITRSALPVRHQTRVALGLQGLDPLHAGCAGSLCLFVPPDHGAAVLRRLRAHPYGRLACDIGEVTGRPLPAVEVVGPDGTAHPLAPARPPEQVRLL